MVVKSVFDNFLSSLVSYDLPNAFNPWRQNCDRTDHKGSRTIRLENLTKIFRACISVEHVDLWVGRDLGWRGGRRTGVPFVDELTMASYGQSLGIESLRKATAGLPLKERTATEINLARQRTPGTIFFWNVFPYHPHEEGKPFTNRMHTQYERQIGEKILIDLVSLMGFRKVIAVGNDAAAMIKKLGIECDCVRHPSYGGQKQFHSQINGFYGIEQPILNQGSLFEGLRIAPTSLDLPHSILL